MKRPVNLHRAVPASRQHGLDVVRAVAIVSVMTYHANNMMLVPRPSSWLLSFGWMGVDLFFVLSGFLIAGQLLKPMTTESGPDYVRFFARRAFRTLPAFAAILLLYFALPWLRETPDIQPFWQFATFTENLFFDPVTPKAFDQVWSLCVEEQFYLLFPLALMLLAPKSSIRNAVLIFLTVLVVGIAVRSLLWARYVAVEPFVPTSASSWQRYVQLIYYPTWSRLDGLLAGIALAAMKTFRPWWWRQFVAQPNLLLALGFAGCAASILLFAGEFSTLAGVALGFPLLSASVALVVAAASTGQAIIGKYRLLGAEALATGAYSLYLTHKMAFHAARVWIAPAFGLTGYAMLAVAVATALFAGALLYLAVERPFLILRDRWDGAVRSNIRDSCSPLCDTLRLAGARQSP